ncbi:MAG: hypothetical protein SGI86_05740 [Deltaproteobacteria bacterium]|nr:hypothetical protein [Deltaproteobacteria bacterium]
MGKTREPTPYQKAPRSKAGRFRPFFAGLALMLCAIGGCKKKSIFDLPKEHGRLIQIASKLEAAFGTTALPVVNEAPDFAARIAAFDDFRDCLIRTYIARRTELDRVRKAGKERITIHASIGDEAVEECAVQAAIANDDPSFCERLEVDYRGSEGERGMPGLRCWDARARTMGRPQECPLVWLPLDGFGRNPECLAMANRDESFCFFAENPVRCTALVRRSEAPCGDPGAASDCIPAVRFWQGIVADSEITPRFDTTTLQKDEGLFFKLRFLSNTDKHDRLHITAPPRGLGVSWPMQGTPTVPTAPRDSGYWKQPLSASAVHVSFRGSSSAKLMFQPGGLTTGTVPLQPPSESAAASLILVLTDERGHERRCTVVPETRGAVRFTTHVASGGGFVTGSLDAEAFGCNDGGTAKIEATFRLAILDTR